MIILESFAYSKAWPRKSGATIILDEGDRLRKLFNAPSFGTYIIYDQKGEMIGSGMNQVGYSQGPKLILNKCINKVAFTDNMIIPSKGQVLRDYQWLSWLDSSIRNSSRKYMLVMLFSSICESCQSGNFFSRLNMFQSASADSIEIRCVLSPDFSEDDIPSLTSQLSITFSVEIADSSLGQKWSELISVYGRESVNGIVFVADTTGLIIEVLKIGQPPDQFLDNCLKLSIGR